jgi:hypothetical protein
VEIDNQNFFSDVSTTFSPENVTVRIDISGQVALARVE